MAETINQPLSASQRNLLNPLTGLLSKGVDTALEIALIREGAKRGSKRAIGSIAPTGQLDPARVESNARSASEPETPTEVKENKTNLPLVIGLSVGTVLVLGILFSARKRGK